VGRILIIIGVLLVVLGMLLSLGGKIPFLGRLPGDIRIERDNFSFYFPLTTCLLISLLASFLFWLFRR
jgi:hypothetical protein